MDDVLDSHQELIDRSHAAIEMGQFDEALAELEAAYEREPTASEVQRQLFAALRQLDVSRQLVRRYLRDMGWTPHNYQGFSGFSDDATGVPDQKVMGQRLHELCDDRNDDIGREQRVILEADRRALGATSDGTDLLGSDSDTNGADKDTIYLARRSYILGKSALEKGDLEAARDHLDSAVVDTGPNGSALRLLGLAQSRLGHGNMARYTFDIAQVFRRPSWLVTGTSVHTGAVATLGQYKSFNIFYAGDVFLAIPDRAGIIVKFEDKTLSFREARASEFRKWLRGVLPEPIMDTLRSVVMSTPLKRFVHVPVDPIASNKIDGVLRGIDDEHRRPIDPGEIAA
jgi:Flp pilus assembly protein TadD